MQLTYLEASNFGVEVLLTLGKVLTESELCEFFHRGHKRGTVWDLAQIHVLTSSDFLVGIAYTLFPHDRRSDFVGCVRQLCRLRGPCL